VKRRSILLGALLLALAACRPSPTTTADVTPDPIGASMTQGRFVLTFGVQRATLRPGDPVVGTATLALLGPGGATITGSSSLFGFEFTEIGGNGRHVVPVFDDVCGPHRVTSMSPISSEILKSGAVVDGPDAEWYRQFLKEPVVHLPKGDWDITVSSNFFDGQGCSGPRFDLRVSVRVHVLE
jgi:hypothetical protein